MFLFYKDNKIILNIYHRETKEATLTNNDGETYYIQPEDIIEILLQKNNHIIFKIINSSTMTEKARYISTNKIEGEYGNPINFYISQNNSSFFRDIKYKEEIPKTILPYNPFINIIQSVE